MNALHQEVYKNYTITLEPDHDIFDPIHDYQDEFKLVSLHRRRGDRHGFNVSEDLMDRLEEIAQLGRIQSKWTYGFSWGSEDGYIVPVWGYEHGNIAFSTSPFSCQFDSGFYGFMYYSESLLKSEWWGKKSPEEISKHTDAVLEEYQAYVNGEGVYYNITPVDSAESVWGCGGFYSMDYALQSAREEIDSLVSRAQQGEIA